MAEWFENHMAVVVTIRAQYLGQIAVFKRFISGLSYYERFIRNVTYTIGIHGMIFESIEIEHCEDIPF